MDNWKKLLADRFVFRAVEGTNGCTHADANGVQYIEIKATGMDAGSKFMTALMEFVGDRKTVIFRSEPQIDETMARCRVSAY